MLRKYKEQFRTKGRPTDYCLLYKRPASPDISGQRALANGSVSTVSAGGEAKAAMRWQWSETTTWGGLFWRRKHPSGLGVDDRPSGLAVTGGDQAIHEGLTCGVSQLRGQ
jgi:hypothetical protein